MGPMYRSPHKKYKASKPPARDGGSWPYKTSVSRNHEGNDGQFKRVNGRLVKVQKRRKAHRFAQQPPGRPRGTCLGARAKNVVCLCGGHNTPANRDRELYLLIRQQTA